MDLQRTHGAPRAEAPDTPEPATVTRPLPTHVTDTPDAMRMVLNWENSGIQLPVPADEDTGIDLTHDPLSIQFNKYGEPIIPCPQMTPKELIADAQPRDAWERRPKEQPYQD